MIFPGFNPPLSEATLATITWSKYPVCDSGGSRPLSVTGNPSLITDPADTYQVMGSNDPDGSFADAVPVDDETGSNAARLLSVPFIRPNFPFAYIGIKFIAGGGSHTGTVQFYYTESSQSTTLN